MYQYLLKNLGINKCSCYYTSYNGMLEPVAGKLSDSEMEDCITPYAAERIQSEIF